MVILHIFITLFFGLLPGLLWMWIIFGTKFKGMLLWIFSWLIGWAYIAFGLYIIQFVHHGIGWIERFFLLLIPIIIISIIIFTKKSSFGILKETLLVKIDILEIKNSYKKLSPALRIVFWLLLVYIIWYIAITFTHNISFPSYHMDSLLHLNEPALSIAKNNGFYFSDYTQIYYPFFVAIYKSLTVIIIGNRNENLINIYQWIIFFIMSLFVVNISWKKTNNIIKTILPLALIYSLPLVYFEVVDGYLDLTMVTYTLVTIRARYIYLEKKDFSYLLLGWIFCCIQAFIKDDGFFVYIPVLLISFTLFLLIKNNK